MTAEIVVTSQTLSRAAIDHLGDRLRGEVTEADLRLLDQYRRSFRLEYEIVIDALRDKLGIEVSGRPAKSTTAIVDKLRRGSIRLSQMQDIAGCRIIVSDLAAQDRLVPEVEKLFQCRTDDRRMRPSHGYRAVHVIARPGDLPIEIQIRTRLQHLWAEVSEKLADRYGIDVKYGKGDGAVQGLLADVSGNINALEALETSLQRQTKLVDLLEDLLPPLQRQLSALPTPTPEVIEKADKLARVTADTRIGLEQHSRTLTAMRQKIQQVLAEMMNLEGDIK